jgi:hypothetical protein
MAKAEVLRSGTLLFQRIISALGTVALAVHRIAVNVESLSFMPGWGLSVAISTLVGQSLGAGRPDPASASIRRGLLIGGALMGAVDACFGLFGRAIASAFGSTPEVLDLARMAVQITAPEQPVLAAQFVLVVGLHGAGDIRLVGGRDAVLRVGGPPAGDYPGLGVSGSLVGQRCDVLPPLVIDDVAQGSAGDQHSASPPHGQDSTQIIGAFSAV